MATKSWAIALVVLCTLFTSNAQLLFKAGAARLPILLTNWPLIGGLSLYAIGAVLLILALKGGEVTVIYPIIATSYIWVGLLSHFVFGESLSWIAISGIALIALGVACIGLSGSKKQMQEVAE